MKLSNALRQVATTLKAYIDKVVPKKLSDLEIDMEIIGGSGVSSWNDLADKPFYAEETETKETLFETQTVPFGIMGSVMPDPTGTIFFMYDLSSYMSLLPDVTYTIVLDGEEYISKPKCAILYDEPCYYLGNSKFMGLEDTGEPFILTRMDGEFGRMDCAIGIETQSNGKELGIDSTIIERFIKQIDKEFIPNIESKSLVVTFTGAGTEENPYSCDVEFDEIYQAVNSGRAVKFYARELTYDGAFLASLDELYSAGSDYYDSIKLKLNSRITGEKYTISYYYGNYVDIIPTPSIGSWNNLEDKPFYEYEEYESLIFATLEDGQYSTSVEGVELEVNTIYKVILETNYFINEYEYKWISGGSPATGFNGYCLADKNSTTVPQPVYTDSGIMMYKHGNLDIDIQIDSSKISPPCSINICKLVPAVKTLDEKYIPDTIARKSDIPLTPISSLITEKISNLTARADLKGVFTHKYQQLYIYNDTTYNMIQFLYGGLNGVIGIFGAGYVNIRVKSFTDADNLILEVRFSNGDYCYITVTDGVFNMIYKYYVYQDEILTKTNTIEYTPISDFHPATKLYVDSLIPSEMDALALLTEVGFVNPAANNGYILTDAKGTIYTF